MTWVKGQSGNQYGGALRKPFKMALVMELLRDGPDMPALTLICRKLKEQAQDGDIQSAKLILETLDGKAAQTIETTINDSRDISTLSPEQVDSRIEELTKRRQRYLAITARASAEDVK